MYKVALTENVPSFEPKYGLQSTFSALYHDAEDNWLIATGQNWETHQGVRRNKKILDPK